MFQLASSAKISVKIVTAEENIAAYLPQLVGYPVQYIEELLFGRDGTGLARYKFYLAPDFYNVEFTV